jgi:hypothetical protein
MSIFGDAAVQCAILTGAGVAVGQAHLMHINRKTCVYPDLSTLFQRQDITAEVFALQPQVSDRLSQFQTLATTPTAPEVAIGDHCRSPYPCPLQSPVLARGTRCIDFHHPPFGPSEKAAFN